MNLPIVQNNCNGMGDAVCYAWVLHSAHAAGITIPFAPQRNMELFQMLRCFRDEWGHPEGDPKDKDVHHPKGERGKGGWVRTWLQRFGAGDVPLVRPPYREKPSAGEWADELWAKRDAATGSAVRVLVCPGVVYKIRDWGKIHFAMLTRILMEAGYNVVTMLEQWDDKHPYAWATGGHDRWKLAAAIKRAHLVIGNDSGPAHLAGTLGVPTLAVVGGSPGDLYFEHLPEVRCMSVGKDRAPCVGCAFSPSAGYRPPCDSGCAALIALTPWEVAEQAKEIVGPPSPPAVSFPPAGRGATA